MENSNNFDNQNINTDENKLEQNKDIQEACKTTRAKQWFITYPECNLEPSEVLRQLEEITNFRKNHISEYLIVQERHQNMNPHIHAYINFVKKITWNVVMFDLHDINSIKVFHGNYQKVRKKYKVLRYILKDTTNYVSNIPEKELIKVNYTKIASTKLRNEELLESDLCQLCMEGKYSISALPNLYKAVNLYKSLDTSGGLIRKVKCIWLYGPSGVGKSYVVRQVFPKIFSKPRSKWWDGYNYQSEILFEDFDKTNTDIISYLKIWADGYKFAGEIKGSFCMPIYNIFIVTSNYKIDEIIKWDKDMSMNEAITRRFIIIEFNHKNKYNEIFEKLSEIKQSIDDA